MKRKKMLKWKTVFWFVGLVCIGWIGCSKHVNTTAPPTEPNEMEKVDDMVYRYMGDQSVSGVTLAVAKDGKLVYAKAYGFADESTAERMKVETRSRISSVSKTVTAIAIMKLSEEGKISLDDKIFGDDGVLENDFGTRKPYREYVTDLTIRHCLSHHMGGWGNASNDPTMMQNSLDATALVSWIIDNVPLSAPPGTSYTYSNVGFMILGRVIEKVTDKTYEQYVQDDILGPVGITRMEIGGNTLADRKPNEARYHNSNAYTRNFQRRDANGGWIATASDMVKLFIHIDGFATVPDILTSASIQTMITPPFSYKSYGLGVMLTGSKWYHGGSFSGSRSHWVRTNSGFVAMIMVNDDASNLSRLLDDIVSASVTWPNQDLFK